MTPSPDLLIFYKPGCPFAARLRIALTLARITHQFQPFRHDEDPTARVRDASGGNEVSPTVLVRGTYLINPKLRAIRAALR